jgi:hypothetical protein
MAGSQKRLHGYTWADKTSPEGASRHDEAATTEIVVAVNTNAGVPRPAKPTSTAGTASNTTAPMRAAMRSGL